MAQLAQGKLNTAEKTYAMLESKYPGSQATLQAEQRLKAAKR